MNPHQFTDLVNVLENKAEGNELAGQPQFDWQEVATVYGDLRPWSMQAMGGREQVVGHQVLASMDHRLWTRREGIDANTRMRLHVHKQTGGEVTLEVLQVVSKQTDFYEWRCRELE